VHPARSWPNATALPSRWMCHGGRGPGSIGPCDQGNHVSGQLLDPWDNGGVSSPGHSYRRASQEWGITTRVAPYSWIWSPPAPTPPSTEVAEVLVAPEIEPEPVAIAPQPERVTDIELRAGLSVQRRRWLWWLGQTWMRLIIRRR
jgi:hypothetical protein